MEFLKKKQKVRLTEGEELIEEYLDEEDIKAIPQKEITNLTGDNCSKRVADFYLQDYKIYIEFLGKWNKPKKQEEYRKKMRIYRENSIPCVYLFPDNLGTLDFILKRRIKKELQKNSGFPNNLKWQLFKWNWKILVEKLGLAPIILIFLIFYIDIVLFRVLFGLLVLNTVYYSLKDSFFKKID